MTVRELRPVGPVLDLVGDGDSILAKRLGRYELCFELASGGMATVYLARMIATDGTGLERLVALKLVHRHLAKEEHFRQMFLDEARIVSRINHPNVCTIHDFGEERSVYYIAMELLDGETVQSLVYTVARMPADRRPRQWAALCARIVSDAAEGLHAAHELIGPRGEALNVVHRDISPQNLFVCYDGSIRVVDFGIARAADRQHQTVTGHLKGKFAYMAPEQITARPFDRRVDVWGLGIVLWEMLTRRRLFKRDNEILTVDAIRSGAIPPPSQVWPETPPELEAVAMKALERDPDARYKTARDLSRDLRRYLLTLPEPVEMAELAEFMRATFAEQYASRRTLREIAEAAATSTIPSVGLRRGDTSEGDTIELDVEATPATAPPPAWHSRRRRLAAVGAAASLAAILLAAVLGWSLLSSDALEGKAWVPKQQPTVADPADPEPADTEEAAVAIDPPTHAPEEDAPAPSTLAEARAPAGLVSTGQPEREASEPVRADRPVRTSPATSRRPGTVVLAATPWGIVEDRNGRRLGETLQPISLPAGSHLLYVRRTGTGPRARIVVAVEPGRRVHRTVRYPSP